MFAPESSLTSANPFCLNFFTTTLCVSPEDCKQIAQDLWKRDLQQLPLFQLQSWQQMQEKGRNTTLHFLIKTAFDVSNTKLGHPP